MLLLLYDALKWIRNIFDWSIRNMAARNVCERAPARIQIRNGSQENRTNWVSDAVYYITLATAKCFSIQAIKLVRLIYWAWTAEAQYSRIDTHTKEANNRKGQCVKEGQWNWKGANERIFGSCIYVTCITRIQAQNGRYPHCITFKTMFIIHVIDHLLCFCMSFFVVVEKKEFLYVRNLNVCVCECKCVFCCCCVTKDLCCR